jgi:hypothetical protein
MNNWRVPTVEDFTTGAAHDYFSVLDWTPITPADPGGSKRERWWTSTIDECDAWDGRRKAYTVLDRDIEFVCTNGNYQNVRCVADSN